MSVGIRADGSDLSGLFGSGSAEVVVADGSRRRGHSRHDRPRPDRVMAIGQNRRCAPLELQRDFGDDSWRVSYGITTYRVERLLEDRP
jgi:hypothetical protein